MGLFSKLKTVTDAEWAIEQSASAARRHRCFTSYFGKDDVYNEYKDFCGPLIREAVKVGTYFKTKTYAIMCLDTSKHDDSFIEKWFAMAPTVVPFIKKERKPVLFINDIISIETKTYTWNSEVTGLIEELVNKYKKTNVIYCDDTEVPNQPILIQLGFKKFIAGGVTYWRYGGF